MRGEVRIQAPGQGQRVRELLAANHRADDPHRFGTGRQRLVTKIAPMSTKPVEDLEPLSAKSLRRFIAAYTTVPDQPVSVYLPGFSQIRLTGADDARRSLARALLVQLVTFHAPEEVVVALCLSPEAVRAWEWAKWLPHVQHPIDQDAAGYTRLVGDGIDVIERLLRTVAEELEV